MKSDLSNLFFEPWTRSIDRLPGADYMAWRALHDEKVAACQRPHWQPVYDATLALPDGQELARRAGGPLPVDYAGDAVRIGSAELLQGDEAQRLRELAMRHHPWRKGPWELCGLEIDAEWRSHLKWDRLAPSLGDLRGKKVMDVGCGNGYYMYRMLAHNPDLVIGFDPAEKFFHAFHFMQRVARDERLLFSLLGVEELGLFPGCFDVLLCMGILYHQRDPLKMLQALRDATTPGGQVYLETLGLPGRTNDDLVPRGRYAKMRNVYHVPTTARTLHWMQQAGFQDVELISSEPTTLEEQRRTEWMTFESLADFLDPEDRSKTVEGYPAPWRFLVRGTVGRGGCPRRSKAVHRRGQRPRPTEGLQNGSSSD